MLKVLDGGAPGSERFVAVRKSVCLQLEATGSHEIVKAKLQAPRFQARWTVGVVMSFPKSTVE